MSKFKSDSINWLILISAFVVLLEVTFFNEGLIFSLFVSGAMIFFGRKWYHRLAGKGLFWMGVFFFVSSLVNMMTFRLFLLAVLLYLLLEYVQSKKRPEKIEPTLVEPKSNGPNEVMIEQSTLFQNTLFGHRKTPDHVYEWNDVNIVAGVGDTVIDFSYTVLPQGEVVVFIRHFFGNIKVYVPYDMEVTIHHSALIGRAEILEFQRERAFNQNVAVKTAHYDQANQKIKIFTSIVVGDLEVKRI